MPIKSINPYNQEVVGEYNEMTSAEVQSIIHTSNTAFYHWKTTNFETRRVLMHNAANVLRARKEEFATLITLEMGKRIVESRSEIDKCALVCDYYAENAEEMLKDELIKSDASRSFVTFQPLGVILAVMPWNFPFWQVFRFAVPVLMSGNVGLLKHASNTQGCALAIESVFREAGFAENVFRSLIVGSSLVDEIIANPTIRGVALTGSEPAGRAVASAAGRWLKKSVLELGGSDPFIVLADAAISEAAKIGAQSRMITSGQTCISAKRFIVEERVADEFISEMKKAMSCYIAGNPQMESTTFAPLARKSLVDDVKKQVESSIRLGAKLETEVIQYPENSCFFNPTILTNVTNKMPVFYEETFGPVAAIISVNNENEAVEAANNSLFGLGASIWTSDVEKGEIIARKVDAGAVFINGLVKSDPRLPFGGIKNSGYGRELSGYGLKEFMNIKSVWRR